MFIESSLTVRMATWLAPLVFVAAAAAHAEETIDAFARAHLKASQEAKDAQNAPATGRAQDDAPALPPRPDVPPELLFIYGVENATLAYLRVDGRFGRNVTKGDKVGDWQVVAIGDDFVDVRRGARLQRLLLPNAFGAAPALPESTSQRQTGRPHGNAR